MTNKKRWLYFILIVVTVIAGLATRSHAVNFPYLITTYGGDTLYATNIFFCLRFVFPRPRLINIAIITYVFCIVIETLQLYQAPWMIKLRHTPPFGLILGFGFLWSDMVCYFAGTLLAWIVSYLLERRFKVSH